MAAPTAEQRVQQTAAPRAPRASETVEQMVEPRVRLTVEPPGSRVCATAGPTGGLTEEPMEAQMAGGTVALTEERMAEQMAARTAEQMAAPLAEDTVLATLIAV